MCDACCWHIILIDCITFISLTQDQINLLRQSSVHPSGGSGGIEQEKVECKGGPGQAE